MKKVLLLLLLLFTSVLQAQQKAFPSALGEAAYITGGRGGAVLHVTDLSNSNSQGSLRWAISQKYPRTIVFDVSGEIDLGGSTQWFSGADYGDLTIAGQTAPEGGITIVNGQFTIQSASNIIVRYIKFRGGYYQDQKDSFRIFQCSDVIIDHCDIWYGRDEGLDISDKNDETDGTVTVQNCLFAENKTAMILGIAENDSANPSYLPVSVLNNLFVNNSHRFPKYDGEGRVDLINNGIHNWKWRTVRFDAKNFELNQINNYYQAGTNSTTNTNTADGLFKVGTSASGYRIYTDGNYLTPSHASAMGISGFSSDNTLGWSNYNNANAVSSSVFVGSPYVLNGETFTPLSAVDARQNLIDNAGARHYLNADGSVGVYLDNLQTTYIGYFENDNSVSLLDYNSEYGTQAVGVPSLTRSASYDTDSDGMADTWETATFGDLTKDGTADTDADGYTDLEEFLNLVDGTPQNIPQITRTDANSTVIEQGGVYNAPTGTWTDVEDGSGNATVGGDTVDVNTIGTYNVTLFHTDTDSNIGTLIVPIEVVATVVNVTGITWDNNTQSIGSGDTVGLAHTFTPDNASDTGVTYSSSNSGVLSDAGVWVAQGTANLTITTDDGSFTDVMAVTCNAADVPVTGVSITPTTATISVGNTQQFTEVFDGNPTDQTGIWSSSNDNLATIDQNGLATALAPSSNTVANGGFDSDIEWTKQDNAWTIANGVASCDGTQASPKSIYQDASILINKAYSVTFTVSNYSAGGVKVYAGGDVSGALVTANGTYTHNLEVTSIYDPNVWVQADANFIGDIDNVTVFEFPLIKFISNDGAFEGISEMTINSNGNVTRALTKIQKSRSKRAIKNLINRL